LTDAGIKSLKPRHSRYEIGDAVAQGLTLRVWPNGSKKWSVWYLKPDGEARRYSIGPYGRKPGFSLSEARDKAREVIADAKRGKDPQGEKQKTRAARKARRDAPTLSDLLDDFVKDQTTIVKGQPAKWRPATKAGWERFIKADIKPHLGSRIPSEVTDDDVVHFIEKLKKERGPISVSRCFEVLRRAFNWAVTRRKLDVNPCSKVDKELLPDAQPSERVYSDDELLAILAASTATRWRLLVPWVLYTGARGNEARSAEWAHIDLKQRIWTVPADNSKNRAQHRVPLSAGALAVLDELRGRSDRFLFPAPTKTGHLEREQKDQGHVRRVSGVGDFKLHDLRRTVRQRQTDAGVDHFTAESILGHLPSKLIRTYSPQWEPIPQMRVALEAWSREVQRIAKGVEKPQADVVSIAERRA